MMTIIIIIIIIIIILLKMIMIMMNMMMIMIIIIMKFLLLFLVKQYLYNVTNYKNNAYFQFGQVHDLYICTVHEIQEHQS